MGNRFEGILQKKLQEMLRKHSKNIGIDDTIVPNEPVKLKKQEPSTALKRIIDLSNKELNDAQLVSNVSKLQQRLQTIHHYTSGQLLQTEHHIVPLNNLSNEDLQLLFLQFSTARMSHDEMLHYLKSIVPTVRNTEKKFISSEHTCSHVGIVSWLFGRTTCFRCSKKLCWQCKPQPVLSARLGTVDPQPLCSSCISYIRQLDADDWMLACLHFLEIGTIEATKVAFGCLSMVLFNNEKSLKPVIKVARNLFNKQSLFEFAMPLLATVLHQPNDRSELLQALSLASSVLKSLAELPDSHRDAKLELFEAAKEAILLATNNSDGSVEVPNMHLSTDIDSAICELEQKEADHYYNQIMDFWEKRDCESILKLLSNERSDVIIQALQRFISPYEAHFDQMRPDDRSALLFFRGLLKIYQNNFSSAIKDIEKAAWNSCRGDWLSKAVMAAVGDIIEKHSLFSVKKLVDVCLSQNILTICNTLLTEDDDRGLSLIFPSDDELVPSSLSINWPGFYVEGLNVKGHKKFENAVASQVKTGKWNQWEAALAYIDYVPACNNAAEMTICLISSSLWILKYLQCNSSLSNSVKFATLKTLASIVMLVRDLARHLSLGMQMYAFRLCLGALLHSLQITKSVATEEISTIVVELIRSILYNCRFCPFWQVPSVGLSEAELLRIKVDRFHGEFVVRLQNLNSSQRPINEAELRYQLYENDLLHVYPLNDSANAHDRAMEELLKEKGWSWNNVSDLMTSRLSPRDSEGWLIRKPTLGVSMEYASFKGFVFNIDPNNPSVEILVEPANVKQGKIGLFSQEDVETVLQLDSDYGLFFSLDPPSVDQQFHPFQEWRYEPKRLQNTPFLHTMFETDYLMKSFSVGSEVSAKPPFKQRPCKDGLTKGLPFHVAEAIKPVSDRGSRARGAHRFWIQADELIYSETKSGSRIEYRLGELQMKVRSHPLIPGLDGNLKDTDHGNDPNSPEAKFASDLTFAYDEISKHFPMFARLRELAKLQFLRLALSSVLDSLCKQNVPDDVALKILKSIEQDSKSRISEMLKDIKGKVGVWPKAENEYTVSSKTQEVFNKMYIPGHMQSEVRENVRDALRENDRKTVSEVVNILMKVCKYKILRSTLETHVRNWLRESSSKCFYEIELRNLIHTKVSPTLADVKREISEHHRLTYNSFNKAVNSITPKLNKFIPGACNWVPAAHIKEDTENGYSLCYGGVLICPKLTEGYVPPIGRNVRPVKIQENWKYKVSYSQNRSYHATPIVFANMATPRGSSQESSSSGQGGSRGSSGTRSGSSSGSQSGGSSGGDGYYPAASSANRSGSTSDDSDGEDNRDEEPQTLISYQDGIVNLQKRCKRGMCLFPQASKSPSSSQDLPVRQVLLLTRVFNIQKSLGYDVQTKLSREHISAVTSNHPLFYEYFKQPPKFIQSVPVDAYGKEINGNTRGVIYCITCKQTGMKYVGKTTRKFSTRIAEHLRKIQKGPEKCKKPTKLVTHFNSNERSVNDIEVTVLSTFPISTSDQEVSNLETYWIRTLDTKDNGLNMKYSSAEMGKLSPEELKAWKMGNK